MTAAGYPKGYPALLTERGKMLVKVSKGQDAYSVIGDYIENHATVFENIIAVIWINGVTIKELFMVSIGGDFYWDNDWWEGQEDVTLLDFFTVSEAERGCHGI